MKGLIRTMVLTLAFALIAFLGLTSFVRVAPSDPAVWNTDPALVIPADAPRGMVQPQEGGAILVIPAASQAEATKLLARLDQIALATPRTERLAGSEAEGRITWVTRSALWGFPDYTTAEAKPDGLYVHARLRFGRSDLGVNASRLTDWQSRL